MILTKPGYEIMELMGGHEPLGLIEKAGRICYQSEVGKNVDSASKFAARIKRLGHHSVLEHSCLSVKFIVDRGVSHELVRHRLASFSQESTRYCRYGEHVVFVIPPWVGIGPGLYSGQSVVEDGYGRAWASSMLTSEFYYKSLLDVGWLPEQARTVLPNSLKTEIIITANLREWMHILDLRTSQKAHPQMREIMIPLQKELRLLIPEIFGESEADDTE